MTNNLLSEILKLSVAERIQLVEDIWDSITGEPGAVALREELDRRLDDHSAHPGVGRSWSDVKSRLTDYLELESIRSRSELSPEDAELLAKEINRAAFQRYQSALAEVPDVEPEEYDRL